MSDLASCTCCHASESWHPDSKFQFWMPAFAGVTLVVLCLTALPLWAENDPFSLGPSDGSFSLEAAPPPSNRPRSEVEVGIGHIDRDSFKFGEYTGHEKERTYMVGNADIYRREAFDSDNALYWVLKGRNFGLSSRELNLETGVQGDYKISLGYDQSPKFQTDTAKTIFQGVGGDTLTLPAGWVPGDTTSDMTELSNSLKDLKISHERKNYHLGLSKQLSRRWHFKADYRHETKDGKKITGAMLGGWAGDDTVGAVLIPEPLDYVTDQLDVEVGFSGKKVSWEGGYSISLFDKHKNFLMWESPFNPIAGGGAESGRIGLPPDNQFHQFKLAGSYHFTQNTRLTAHAALGKMTQDENFLPLSVTPTGTSLARSSLDGRVDTLLFYTKLSSRPWDKLNWMASYRYDDRDNRTSRAAYINVDDLGNESSPRTNLPFSFKRNQFKLDATYELFYRTYLQGGYEYAEMERTLSEVKKNQEHTYRLEIRQNAFDSLTGGVRLLQAYRRGSTYRPAALQAAGEGHWANRSSQRIFYLANRDRTQGGVFVGFDPCETATIQLAMDFYKDDFTKAGSLGLRENKGQIYTLDATVTPKENISSYLFYTYEHLNSDQKGRDGDVPADWSRKQREGIDTLGTGFTWRPSKGKWNTGAEYTYAHSRGKGPVRSTATVAHVPILITSLHRVDVFLKYKIKESLSAKMNVLYENFNSRDWAMDNVNPTALNYGIGTGEKSPDYSVMVVGASVLYDF